MSAFGCGDSSKQCDPGTTMDVDGVCTGTPTTCTDGTVLVGDHCEVDPNACQDGTVLVGGACVDPGHVTADIEEAAEPNGYGLLGEVSAASAGTINLKPVGQHFVLHGKIVPFQDNDGDGQQDPDVDTYELDVDGPTMLTISSDGLHGLAAGFVGLANVSQTHPLADWTRFGVNPTGDTSSRQLYLPAAGSYLIAIADTRTLFLSGASAGAQEGKPDFEYYVSIDQIDATATALTAADGVATSSGQLTPGETKLFTVAMGEGVNEAELSVAIDQVQESLVIANTHASIPSVKAVGTGDSGAGDPAAGSALGIRTGDETIVVVDNVFDYANAKYDYDLTIRLGTAGKLPTDGTTVSQPTSTTDLSLFYYDVASDGRLVGMDIAFDRPMTGLVVDEDFFIFSNFTYDPVDGFTYEDTFQSYRGLINHELPGRYYFFVYDPAGDTADITATSTYGAVTATPIALGTPLNGNAVNAYGSNPFMFTSPTTVPWQQFTGSGVNTGAITASFYQPGTAIGRLDTLTNSCGVYCDDSPLPIFMHAYDEAGTTEGRIMLDDATPMYLVKVNTATTTGAPTFDLSFDERAHTDLGTANIGTPVTASGQQLSAADPVQRYLVRSNGGNTLTINVHPGTLTDTRIVHLATDETPLGTANNGIAGNDDSIEVIQAGNGWTAFSVTTVAAPTADQFDVSVAASAATTYTQSAGTTTFADACSAGGQAVPLDHNDEGRSTATVSTPTGFDFFGIPAPHVRVFANGFLSVDQNLACAATGGSCFYSNANIPAAAAPNGLIAPFWDDLVLTGACSKTAGSKLIIQWQGKVFGSPAMGPVVRFQAILDGATDTIELVYDTTHAADGATATIGLENQIGGAASKVGFNTAGTATATLFTPN